MDTDHNDETLLRALKQGDEEVFRNLVERWSGIMLRLALSHVESRAIAEEVVQDAWLTVLRSLDRFECRSTFRTWVLRIVVNLARTRVVAIWRRGVPEMETDDREHLTRRRNGPLNELSSRLLICAEQLRRERQRTAPRRETCQEIHDV